MPAVETRCHRCAAPDTETRLERCSICHRPYCRRCAVRRHGKPFCSAACSDTFFFGNPDEDES